MTRHRARRGSPLFVTPALELLFSSWDVVKPNLRLFALLYIFPLVIGLSNGFWVVDTERHLRADSLDAANAVGNPGLPAYAYGRLTVMFVFAMTIAIICKIMLQVAQLRVAEEKTVSLKILWRITKSRWQQMLGLYIVTSAAVAVWLIPAFKWHYLWLELLCFIPALYFLRRFFVAPYVLLEDESLSFWDAMRRSSELTHRDSRSVYEIVGIMLLFALFGIIPFIGWMFAFGLLFMYTAGPAIRYRELKRLT